jgi:hypothetical protein
VASPHFGQGRVDLNSKLLGRVPSASICSRPGVNNSRRVGISASRSSTCLAYSWLGMISYFLISYLKTWSRATTNR